MVACFLVVAGSVVSVAKASVDLRDYLSCLQGRARQFSGQEEWYPQTASFPSWASIPRGKTRQALPFLQASWIRECMTMANLYLQLQTLFVFIWDAMLSLRDL